MIREWIWHIVSGLKADYSVTLHYQELQFLDQNSYSPNGSPSHRSAKGCKTLACLNVRRNKQEKFGDQIKGMFDKLKTKAQWKPIL